MAIRVVRLGSPRANNEGLRIGTVRRPPRGVPKSEFASQDWYDVWYPNLAPSADLVKEAQQAATGCEQPDRHHHDIDAAQNTLGLCADSCAGLNINHIGWHTDCLNPKRLYLCNDLAEPLLVARSQSQGGALASESERRCPPEPRAYSRDDCYLAV